MAAFANDSNKLGPLYSRAPSAPTFYPQHDENASKHTRHKALPEGPCNYRDLSTGPTRCGCRRFWCSFGLVSQQQGDAEGQEPWCVCGHHACFHDNKEYSKRGADSTQSSFDSVVRSKTIREAIARDDIGEQSRAQNAKGDWLNAIPTGRCLDANNNTSTSRAKHVAADTTDVQPIPSFHLTSSELRGYTNYNGTVGLGLNVQRNIQTHRLTSQSPTVPDGASIVGAADNTLNNSWIPSTRKASTEDNISPDGAFMKHIMANRRLGPPLDVTNAQKAPAGLGIGDMILSATEVATPSVGASPDPRAVESLVREATQIVDTIQYGTLANQPFQLSSGQRQNDNGLAQARVAMPGTSADVIQDALQRLAPLLSSLQSQLLRDPDISIHESILSLTRRMDAIENASFNQLPPEQVHEQFQHMDMRLVDLENRADEHGRLISAFDLDCSSRGSRSTRKHDVKEQLSFTSNHSVQSLDSATSSALIAAAIDRVETESRLKAVEGRLDDLEDMQMPSATLPWEVEVVLLPWGSELRGIWYSAMDLMKSGTIQDDEDWTQAMTHRSNSRASASLGEGGWSDKAIHQWADDDEETLWPKACGTNGIVYHRLRSRGLIRKVMLATSGARDIVSAVCKAFGEILPTVSKGDDSHMEEDDEDLPLGLSAPFIPLRKIHKSSRLRFLTAAELLTPTIWAADFLASGVLMRAPRGQKRLFITTRAAYEQANTAVGWSWPRLRELPRVHDPQDQRQTSNVVPEADAKEPCWKHNHVIDSSSSVNSSFQDKAVAGAERLGVVQECAPSTIEVQTRPPLDSESDSEVEARNFRHPITPTSEFPSTQRSPLQHRRMRTTSVPFSDPTTTQRRHDSSAHLLRPSSQQQKRRIRSFEQAPNPAMIAALPSFVPTHARGLLKSRNVKRQRVARSTSASSGGSSLQSSEDAEVESLHPQADPEQVLMHLQNQIPQGGVIKSLGQFGPGQGRDRQQSPFFEADASQSTSRMMQARAVEKRGVTPSAYATPFSGTVAGLSHRAAEDENMASDSGEDWRGVDGEHELRSDDEDEAMNDEDDGSEFDEEADSDEGFYDEDQDDEMDSSSADELQASE